MQAVEKSDDGHGEIEVFTPDELQKLFAACRPEMIPYLAVAAFCGLRAAEIQRLDWSEIHLTGPEHFVEVKASKAKTATHCRIRAHSALDGLSGMGLGHG
jgi:integrase